MINTTNTASASAARGNTGQQMVHNKSPPVAHRLLESISVKFETNGTWNPVQKRKRKMRIFHPSKSGALALLLCGAALALMSCEDAEETDSILDLEETNSALGRHFGMLHLEITFDEAVSSGSQDMELCLRTDDYCYRFSSGANPSYSSGVLYTQEHTSPQGDHPFVGSPDDWDFPYLKNPRGVDIDLRQIKVVYYNANSAVPANWANAPSIEFVNEDFSSRPESIPAQNRLDLRPYLQAQRECLVKSAFCGYDDMRCHEGANCGMNPGYGNVEDVPMDLFPPVVREALKDLGQAGFAKYKPWDTISNNNGCSVFAGYFFSLYTNNIFYSCDLNSATCGAACDDTVFFCSELPCCSFFQQWDHWDTGAERTAYHQLFLEQFIAADRAAIVTFDHDASTGDRTTVRAICRVDSDGVPQVNGSGDCLPGQDYNPKPGDYFVQDK